ncbi:hypothetical protein SS1G_14423 [Sclerotinia sclerotiorum 1980 UF-70]|uniref:Uncharacterized protein n=2 Tax=Sclerotinia sclerotiorum (strain ATCC 18683 / 1980 / Ss-1) TaxID=665079 RepID=A7F9Z2_SCLS1|nr:hypothetical protein SS1G_14423 [Sclerotinia sclerotiorum 1980 UF-70]APA14897.1 hypothetical protein sscle_13g096670 [Sclerotinia sclerotiorum 1980 UF-70]EDO00553.1 hypothetical protein SS1G_14423 [Sclerotinia sclerotiorum 1980 UF-70]
MSHDPNNLYNFKKPKLHDSSTKELSSSTNLAFSSTLSSLLTSNTSSSTTTRGRPRPSKTKEDIFKTHNKGAKKRAAKDLEGDQNGYTQIHKTGGGIDDNTLHRSKKRLAEKAKIYSRLKHGDHDKFDENGNQEEEGLVDFDRKWVEGEKDDEGNYSDDSFGAGGAGSDTELVEYEDEYGRVRQVTKSEASRLERRRNKQLLGAEELERMSARPSMPTQLIYGDTIQSDAFTSALDAETENKMEELARKRDRSATPPEQKHYEADKEVRSKGQGFYSFSKDEALRGEEMENLERMRRETERGRKEREEAKEKRRKEVEERRRVLGEKRAKKQADAFLEGLGDAPGPMEGKE